MAQRASLPKERGNNVAQRASLPKVIPVSLLVDNLTFGTLLSGIWAFPLGWGLPLTYPFHCWTSPPVLHIVTLLTLLSRNVRNRPLNQGYSGPPAIPVSLLVEAFCSHGLITECQKQGAGRRRDRLRIKPGPKGKQGGNGQQFRHREHLCTRNVRILRPLISRTERESHHLRTPRYSPREETFHHIYARK